jgi:ribonuclease P protein component
MGSAGERRKRARLSRSGDFDRVYKEGRSHGNRFLVLHAFPRSADEGGSDDVRLGVSVGRKVGGATERNAVKRALREAFWNRAEALPANYDFVIVARADAADLVEREGTPGVEASLGELFEESGMAEGSV